MVEDAALLDRVAAAGVALEVCPLSNVSLGVYTDPSRCPCPSCSRRERPIALGADDPLLFGSRLAGQYAAMRAAHDLDDATLARLAAMSVTASAAADSLKGELLDGVELWLSAS